MLVSKEVKIGAVFFIAIIILVMFAVAVGALPVGGGHKMIVYFDEVLGLEPGNDVWLYGRKVGTVQGLEYAPMAGPDGRDALMVKVVMNLDQEVPIYEDYKISVMDKSVIGGRAVQIKSGTPGKPAPEGVFYGSSHGNPLASMGEEFSKSLAVVESVGQIAQDLREGKGSLGMLLKNKELYEEMVNTTREIRVMMEMLTAEDSTFRALMKDPEVGRNIRKTAEEMKTVSQEFAAFLAKINSPDSFINSLVTDKTLYARLEAIMAGLETFSKTLGSGRGLTRALTDDAFYHDIQDTAAELKSTVRLARELIAEVQRDPQMLIAGRPSGQESWLVKQLRGEGPPREARADPRKLVPED